MVFTYNLVPISSIQWETPNRPRLIWTLPLIGTNSFTKNSMNCYLLTTFSWYDLKLKRYWKLFFYNPFNPVFKYPHNLTLIIFLLFPFFLFIVIQIFSFKCAFIFPWKLHKIILSIQGFSHQLTKSLLWSGGG